MAKINVRDRNKNNPEKKPNWEYRFEAAKVDGKRQHISKAGFRTKKDALEAGTKALAEYNNAGLHFEPSEISVSDYLDYWFEKSCRVNLRYNTQLNYLNIIEKHLKPYFGYYKLKSINPSILQEYANSIGINGYSKSHIGGILSTFQVALDYAVFPLCYIKENPMRYIKYPTAGKRRRERVVIEKDDYNKIIARFPFGNRFHIAIKLGWYCGLRISEAFALTWDDIDFENKTISISKQIIKRNFGVDPRFILKVKGKKEEKCGWYFTEPKYNSHRTIKIGDNLLQDLKAEKARQEKNEELYEDFYTVYVKKVEKDEKGNDIERILPIQKCVETTLPRVNLICINENGEYTSTDSFKYAARVIKYELKIKFEFHALRHTHATILIEQGVSPKAVQQRLGHKSILTTMQTYVHATENLQDSAVAAFEAANDEKNMSTALENGGQKVDTEILVDTVNSIYSADYR